MVRESHDPCKRYPCKNLKTPALLMERSRFPGSVNCHVLAPGVPPSFLGALCGRLV